MDLAETSRIPTMAYLRGILQPMSSSYALDPFAIKHFSKRSIRRIVWTAQSRALELLAKLTYASAISAIRKAELRHRLSTRGTPTSDTAVTSCQRDLLLEAVAACEETKGDLVEIGSYRGVTTGALASGTRKTVFAVDPYIGYGGAEGDYQVFLANTRHVGNVKHVRKTSGEAAREFDRDSIAFLFIDAVHDFSNSWFDLCAWSRKVGRGGLIALHDVDDHVGVTMTCRIACSDKSMFRPWGYCPNLIIFERV